MTNRYSEETLVASVRQGDKAAFQYLYEYYYSPLFNVICQIVKDPDQAEDVLQDTYVKIWGRFHYYDAQQGTLFTWLLSIARNTALDALRQRRITYFSIGPEEETLPTSIESATVINAIEVEYVVRQHLKPHQWQLIRLAYWQGYTHKEIADELALPLGTVKTRILKSLLRLRLLFH